MLSRRSRLSLSQLIHLQAKMNRRVLFIKHGIEGEIDSVIGLSASLGDAEPDRLISLLSEVIRTQGNLRTEVRPRYKHDERWKDLKVCLLLDGYKVSGDQLVAIDPTIEGTEPLDDDLTALLWGSGLQEADEVISVLGRSADAFRTEPLDLNACLSEARVALETTARAIANVRRQSHHGDYNESKWGSVLGYLRTSEFITTEEEKGLAGVYSFVSPGAHRPVEPDEVEMARLGRSLSIGMNYFFIKRFMEDE